MQIKSTVKVETLRNEIHKLLNIYTDEKETFEQDFHDSTLLLVDELAFRVRALSLANNYDRVKRNDIYHKIITTLSNLLYYHYAKSKEKLNDQT